MIHRTDAIPRARRIAERQSDLRSIAPTKEEGDQQESGNSPDRWSPDPIPMHPERSPGMTMPEAASACAPALFAPTASITRSRCDRRTCKPGNRCPEHRSDATVHISSVLAELVTLWAGGSR